MEDTFLDRHLAADMEEERKRREREAALAALASFRSDPYNLTTPITPPKPVGMGDVKLAEASLYARPAPKKKASPLKDHTPGDELVGPVKPEPQVAAALRKVQNPVVREHMAKRFGFEGDLSDEALKNAQEGAAAQRKFNMLGRGISTMAAAMSDRNADYRAWDAADAEAGQAVADIKERRGAKQDEFRFGREQVKADEEDKAIARAEAERDPASEQSKFARQLLAQRFPETAAKLGDALNNLSASQITNILPQFEKDMERFDQNRRHKESLESNERARKDAAASAAAERSLRREEMRAQRESDRAFKTETENRKVLEKKKEQLVEVQDRYNIIKDNLTQLRKKVDDQGTTELFGSHNKELEQHIDSIATDMAKLVDPSSVARPSEVENFKQMLFQPGFWQREKTVQDVIKNFEDMVDKRLQNAYAVRGLEAPGQTGIVIMVDPDGDTHEVPAGEVEAAKRKGLKEAR